MTGVKRDCRCPLTRHRHGTRSSFQQCGCRCMPCRFAYDEAVRLRRRGIPSPENPFVSKVGLRRRIEALHAIGWSGGEIAARLGVTVQALHHLRTDDNRVYPRTVERVAALYDELWDQPARGAQVTKTRRWAARNGWLPPLAWDDDSIDDPNAEPYRDQYVHAAERGIDEIAVQEAMRGRRVHLYPAEKAEALRRMTERGYSAAAIADRLGTTRRSVVRTRSARGIRGAA